MPQVGVANYFIDLAVRDPRSGGFILGIECDGATYHGSRSARDRDRTREENFLKLGWSLYRIWSTDWFANPRRKIDKLCDHLTSLLDKKTTARVTKEDDLFVAEASIIKPQEEDLSSSIEASKLISSVRSYDDFMSVRSAPDPSFAKRFSNYASLTELLGEVGLEFIDHRVNGGAL